ncbi:DUF2252 domain-containing protein [Streptomyces sp. NBC_01622]|nr:DUF2252 domain-containing protein [Streptomyces sp. NBC_01622]
MLDLPAARPGRPGPALPPGQGGRRHLRTRRTRRCQPLPQPGRAGRLGPAADAATSDIFLGWERVDGIDGRQRDFYVRQLRDWKGIAMPERMQPKDMQTFGELCGVTQARAHARSGDRIAIAAYLGSGDSSAHSPPSRRHTPTRTSVTTRPWSTRCARAGYPHRSCRQLLSPTPPRPVPRAVAERLGCWRRDRRP